MDAVQILKAAREKVMLSWGQGARGTRRHFDTCCAAEAIEECSLSPGFNPERVRAYRAIYNAAGLDWRGDRNLTEWNDSPDTTHAMVMAAFNLAIATLRL